MRLGEVELPQPTSRSRSQPANVVRNLHQAHGDCAKFPAGLNQGILRRLSLEVVDRLLEGTADLLREECDHARGEFGMCVQTGTHSRPAECHLAQCGLGVPSACNTQFNLPSVSAKLLAQSDRRGILKMRPPDLEHVVELVRFGRQGAVQAG